jgi:excisionase family DNA binding protein
VSTPAPANDNAFYTVKEAAALLKVDPKTVRALMATGRLKFIQLGPRLTRIHSGALAALAK